MRILLIQSYLGPKDKVPPIYPLGLAYLSQALTEHECTIIDPNIEDYPVHAIEKTLEKTNPEIIGISLRNIDVNSFSFLPYFESLLKLIKKILPDAKIVVGGTGFSLFAKEIMEKYSEIDFGVFLEAEYSFPALLKNLNHPEQVQGIYFRNKGKIFFTGKNQMIDFGQLPEPPRNLPEINLDRYKKYPFSIGVQTLRGCLFNCAYCTYPYLQGRQIRLRSPKKVVDEIEHLSNNYGIQEIYFADTIFNYPFIHGSGICKELLNRKLKIKWVAYFRENLINKQFLIEARNSGCARFEFSPDGGSTQALNVLQKEISIKDIKKSCELISEIEGITVNYNFFYNVPKETLASLVEFFKLLSWIKLKLRKTSLTIFLTNIRIYPNTCIYEIAKKEGMLSENQSLLTPTFYNPPPHNYLYRQMKRVLISPVFN